MSSHYIVEQVPVFEGYAAASFVLGILTVGGTAAASWATFRLTAGGDPARSFIKWLKVSMALYLIFVLTYAASATVIFVAYEKVKHSHLPHQAAVFKAQRYLNGTAYIAENLCQITLFLTFLSLGADILRVSNGPNSRVTKLVRYPTYFVVGVLVAFSIVSYSLICSIYSFAGSNKAPSNADAQAATQSRFSFSWTILVFAAAMAAFTFSLAILVKSRSRFTGSPCMFFITSTVTLVVQTVYELACYSVYSDPNGGLKKIPDLYLFVLDYFFSLFPLLFILALLTILGQRSVNGLHSSAQQQHKEVVQEKRTRDAEFA